MKLAYFSNFFPSLTETFIYREVIELRRRGIEVLTYSLRRPERSTISGEAEALYAATFYLLPVRLSRLVGSHLRFLLGSPLRYVGTFMKMVAAGGHRMKRSRRRSLMHFGEGVVLATRRARTALPTSTPTSPPNRRRSRGWYTC
jgi:hypothetical protein